MATTITNPKPRRRWFRFMLRTLLVLMFLVCIGMGWFAMKMRQANGQREAVIAILLEGGNVQQWSQEFAPLPQGTPVPTRDTVIPPPISKRALEIERALGFGPPPPSYAKESRAHAWLRRWLGDDFFTHPVRAYVKNDAGTKHLDGLPQLEELTCHQITDAGLTNLRWIPQLGVLTLSGDQITDAGLANLKWLPQLKSLSVEGRRITDASVEHLKGLSKLTELQFKRTQVSDNGVKELQKALPNCNISR